MARPTKCRRVCTLPDVVEFSPTGGASGNAVLLTVDEFEVIRLIDREGLSQEQCGEQLGVGRTTVQKIYDAARKKIADVIVLGRTLKIEGGDFSLCNGGATFCYNKDCFKKKLQNKQNKEKGDNIMKIAVTYQNGEIFQHFGHTEQFKLYDVQDGKVVASRVVDTNGSGHGALAGLLSSLGVDVLICGGIGGGAQTALAQHGIKLYGGVCGNADKAVQDFVAGNLNFDANVHCSHHDHEHGEEHHSCGNHGCGHGHCGDK